MMCADAGSPRVLRFGEKGTIWMTIEADGVAGHGAHTHLTVNAIDRLVDAISAIRTLRETAVTLPSKIVKAILMQHQYQKHSTETERLKF